jgi:preprotein translocase subunit SecG
MYALLLTLLLIDSVVLVAAVLLQSGKGGGMAATFGGAGSSSDAFIGTRQAGNLLTKASWWSGGLFLFLSFVLQIMSTHTSAPKSVLDKSFGAPPPASTAPVNSGAGSPVPLTPASPAPATPAPNTGAGQGTKSAPTTPQTKKP